MDRPQAPKRRRAQRPALRPSRGGAGPALVAAGLALAVAAAAVLLGRGSEPATRAEFDEQLREDPPRVRAAVLVEAKWVAYASGLEAAGAKVTAQDRAVITKAWMAGAVRFCEASAAFRRYAKTWPPVGGEAGRVIVKLRAAGKGDAFLAEVCKEWDSAWGMVYEQTDQALTAKDAAEQYPTMAQRVVASMFR